MDAYLDALCTVRRLLTELDHAATDRRLQALRSEERDMHAERLNSRYTHGAADGLQTARRLLAEAFNVTLEG